MRAVVFAGTTEGYFLCRYLSERGISVLACVATEYGEKSLTEGENLRVRSERLGELEMKDLFLEVHPELVIDATHPYAREVTENIRLSTSALDIQLLRVLRKESPKQAGAVYVEDTACAVEYLKSTRGNILLTTGSRELEKYTALPDYRERLYARVLSLPSVIESCRKLGLEGRHLIAMQGPFSRELNEALLRQYDCRILVTKDSGDAGGFQEKIDAAVSCQALPLIIGRPPEEEGMDPEEALGFLNDFFKIQEEPRVTLLGVGMGGEDTLTLAGKKAAAGADLIIGSRRAADAVRSPGQSVFYEYRKEEIRSYLKEHPQYRNVLIALSGDVGFYSGAGDLLDLAQGRVICGIPSVVYFMSRIGLSWDDAKIVSVHGRSCNLVHHIGRNKKVFALLGRSGDVAELSRKLVSYGLGEVQLYIGENLSYENERIFSRKAKDLTEYEGDPLSVLCAVNESPIPLIPLRDQDFIRGQVPMTKEEVRTVVLSKLALKEDSVCIDVGAGTGSVSVEMALKACEGTVYAVEKKPEAVELIRENKRRFLADNLEIISGFAPEALEDLPVPTHVFIGGSSGNLREIVQVLLGKNPNVRMVITCVTLETLQEALVILRENPLLTWEVVQTCVSRAREVGAYHMMRGENPVTIITCQRGEDG